jgi:hypothetical protein
MELAMSVRGFDRLKVLSTANVLQTFTVRSLSAQALVDEAYVHKIVAERDSEFFEPIDRVSGQRGRPAVQYRVQPGMAEHLKRTVVAARYEFDQVSGPAALLSKTSIAPESSKPSPSLLAAENELLNKFLAALGEGQKRAVLKRAATLLEIEAQSKPSSVEIDKRRFVASLMLDVRQLQLDLSKARGRPRRVVEGLSHLLVRAEQLFVPMMRDRQVPERLKQRVQDRVLSQGQPQSLAAASGLIGVVSAAIQSAASALSTVAMPQEAAAAPHGAIAVPHEAAIH